MLAVIVAGLIGAGTVISRHDNLAAAYKQKSEHLEQPNKTSPKNESTDYNWTAVLSIVTLGTLIFQTWVFFRQASVMHRQADIYERQTRLMGGQLVANRKAAESARLANSISRGNLTATRRAWLSIETVTLKFPTEIHKNGGATIAVDVLIKNFGITPALSVWVNTVSVNAEKNVDRVAFERSLVDEARQHPAQLGAVIFPGDELVQGDRRYCAGSQSDDWDETAGDDDDPIPTVNIELFVSVSYRIMDDTKAHVTHFAYGLLNLPIGFGIDREQGMSLSRVPFLTGVVD